MSKSVPKAGSKVLVRGWFLRRCDGCDVVVVEVHTAIGWRELLLPQASIVCKRRRTPASPPSLPVGGCASQSF
jgi:hypothetical protein